MQTKPDQVPSSRENPNYLLFELDGLRALAVLSNIDEMTNRRNTIYALGLISALALAQGCDREPIKEIKTPVAEVQIDGENHATTAKSPIAALIAPSHPTCEQAAKGMVWRDGVEPINSLLQEIHRGGLSPGKAIQLALVNNPDLLAYYENLELGHAGLLEAGLRQNPVVQASTRFPSRSGEQINHTFDASINFLDFFLIPLRQRAAEAEIRVIESQIGQKVLDLGKEVQIDWLEVKIIELELDKEGERVELKELAAGLAERQKRAGNISASSARSREIEYHMAAEKLKDLKAVRETAREKISRTLGLFGYESCWQIDGHIDGKENFVLPRLVDMERAALQNRPDIEAIRREINAIAQKAQLKQWWTYSNLLVGVSSESEPDGLVVAGPSIEFEIPVFNYGQGEMKKYGALLRQEQKRMLSKAVEACSQVREFLDAANIYRSKLEDFEMKILPDLAKQIDDGLARYNVMTLGVYELLDLKEAEIQAAIERLRTLRAYKKAYIELLHALGGSFAPLGRRP